MERTNAGMSQSTNLLGISGEKSIVNVEMKGDFVISPTTLNWLCNCTTEYSIFVSFFILPSVNLNLNLNSSNVTGGMN